MKRIVVAMGSDIPMDIEEKIPQGDTILTYDAEDTEANDVMQKIIAIVEESRGTQITAEVILDVPDEAPTN